MLRIPPPHQWPIIHQSLALLLAAFLLVQVSFWAWGNRQHADTWDLVPGNALAVIEMQAPGTLKDLLLQADAGQEILAWPAVQEAYLRMRWLDSLAEGSEELAKILYESRAIASIHLTGPQQADVMAYIRIGHRDKDMQWVYKIMNGLGQRNGWLRSKRTYRGHTIEELRQVGQTHIFGLLHYQDHLLTSSNPLLLEEAIRWSEGSLDASELPAPSSTIEEGTLRIMLNMQALSGVWNHAMPKPLLGQNLPFQTRSYWMLEAHAIGNIFSWQGKLLLPTGKEPWSFLSESKEEGTVKPLDSTVCLPKQAALLAGWRLHEMDQLRPLLPDQPSDWADLEDYLAEGIFWVLSQTNDAPEYDPVWVVALEDKEAMEDYLDDLDLDDEEVRFPALMPENTTGALLLGLKKAYCKPIGRFMAVAERAEALKTFSFSEDQACFLKNGPSFSLNIQPALLWPLLGKIAAPSWRHAMSQAQVQALRMAQVHIEIQNRKLGGGIFFHPRESQAHKIGWTSASLPAEPLTAPQLVLNPITHAWEVLLQDRWNNLKLISSEGKVQWSHALGAPIITPIWAVDHYQNGKHQYLFQAGGKIHLVDRNGAPSGGYPHVLPFQPHLTSLLPAPVGYWLGMDDGEGNLYVYNHSGKALSAWNPRRNNQPLALPLQGLKVGEDRLLLSLLKGGGVNVFKEDGTQVQGFPVTFQHLEFTDAMAWHADRKENAFIYLLANRATVLQIDLYGKLKKQWQLPSATPEGFCGFIAVGNKEANTVVAQLHEGKAHFFSLEGTHLIDVPMSAPLQGSTLQVEPLDGGNWCIALHNQQEKKLWLYYGNGHALQQPLPCDFPPSMVFLPKTKQLLVCRAVGKQCILDRLDAQGSYATQVVP